LRDPALLAFKGSLSALVGGGLVLLAAAGLLESPAVELRLASLLPGLTWVMIGAGVLLAWRFDRIRVIFALVVIALTTWGVAFFPAGAAERAGRGGIVWGTLVFLLPLDLAVFAWFTERGLLSRAGRLNATLIATELAAVLLLCADAAGGPPRLLLRIEDYAHGLPALAVFAAAFVVTAARFALRRSAVDAGFGWALVGAFLALRGGGSPFATALYLAATALILVISLVEESYALAYVDELTGLPGRRALNAALLKLGPRYTLAMVDIDHFKKLNDAHGHLVGDQVLRKVAAALARVTGGGHAFRFGGEEFAVVFPGCSVDETLPHLEGLRQRIEASAFVVRAGDRPRRKPKKAIPARRPRKTLHITASLGAAAPNGRVATPNQVLAAADGALYRAKRAGRNRVSS
jgi:diguanylate cyclase (GGDEF)-like protein